MTPTTWRPSISRASTESTSSSRATARCCAFPGWLRRHGIWSCSTRPRPSRTPPPSRRTPRKGSRRGRASPSPARRSRTGSATCGRSSTSSTRACSARPRSSRAFAKRLAERPHNPYGPLRDLVRPYILRRLKTDQSIIADLPEKTEMKAFCQLSRKQAALYQQAVKELAEQLDGAEGHRAARAGAGLPHALQADLQPPVSSGSATGPGPTATAASGRGCASSPK